MIVAIAFLLLVQIGVAGSTQSDCTDKDHSQKLGEVRNQGQIGWCYANAAADLLTFRYYKELKGQKVSQAHVALTFNEYYFQKSNAEGGFGWKAVQAYLESQRALCPQSIEEHTLSQGVQMGLRERLEKANRLKALYDLQREDSSRWASFFTYLQSLKKEKSVVGSLSNELLFELLEKSNHKNFTFNLANALCAPYAVPINEKPKTDMDFSAARLWMNGYLIETIHEQLNKNNILALAYYASILTDKNSEVKSDSRHMSVIVGRRWNKQDSVCEFKIRNSWGPSCANYTNPVFQKTNACDQGNVWISEKLLKESMYGISYLY